MTTQRVVLAAVAVALVALAACAPRVTETRAPLPEAQVFDASREAVHQVIIERLNADGWVLKQSDVAGGFISAEKSLTVTTVRGLMGTSIESIHTQALSFVTSAVGDATRVLIQGGATRNEDFNERVLPTAFAVMEDLAKEFGTPE